VGKGQGKKERKAELTTKLAQTEPPQPSSDPWFALCLVGRLLPSPCLSVSTQVCGDWMEVHVNDCPKIGVLKNFRAIWYLKSATGSSELSVSLPTILHSTIQRRAKLDPGGSIPAFLSMEQKSHSMASHSPLCSYAAKGPPGELRCVS